MERAPSTSSDESVTPGEANMWHRLLELAYHQELGEQLLKAWCKTSAAWLPATCMFAIMVALLPRASGELFAWDLAVPGATVKFSPVSAQCVRQTRSSPAASAAAMSKRPALFREAISFQRHRPSSKKDDDELVRLSSSDDG